MKILFLGYNENQTRLISFIKNFYEVTHTSNKIDFDVSKFDLIISFGYRHILSSKILDKCKRPPVNLHISYLPFNRGVHPNFWAWYQNTPHGVTIHHIDRNIDTGGILFQKKITFKKGVMLSISYEILLFEIEKLFLRNFFKIINFDYSVKSQKGINTFHRLVDLPPFSGGWHQTIDDIIIQIDGLQKEGFLIRNAKLSDTEDIYHWRNDPLTREMSFQKEKFTHYTHKRWWHTKA